jgi:hypothetical protein
VRLAGAKENPCHEDLDALGSSQSIESMHRVLESSDIIARLPQGTFKSTGEFKVVMNKNDAAGHSR